jgi:hypothetical protein
MGHFPSLTADRIVIKKAGGTTPTVKNRPFHISVRWAIAVLEIYIRQTIYIPTWQEGCSGI